MQIRVAKTEPVSPSGQSVTQSDLGLPQNCYKTLTYSGHFLPSKEVRYRGPGRF
jgi:hypothetical protein